VLLGRRAECEVLDALVADVLAGRGRALVLRGEAGVGKSALLEYVVEKAAGWHLARADGVESEMQLPYAALHQLCAPMLDHVEALPGPQREALKTVFGLSTGPAPDGFLVGLGVLTLVSEVLEERSLLCVVDDAQWLDEASARTLAFVSRRLQAERVGVVFAARESGDVLSGLPEIEVRGLRNGDARALLDSAVRVVIDARVRDRIIAETRGNPLALLELPRGLSVTELASGVGVLGEGALSGQIEESFLRRLGGLPDETRELLLVAAAEPLGDPQLIWEATEGLGIDGPAAAVAAEAEGLLTIGYRVAFRHPLVRSAVYRRATPSKRRAAHRALGNATDAGLAPDWRAWHLAAAAAGPDEAVAAELERSAERAQARGGLAAAAAFLQRSVELTGDRSRRADRALAAAQASLYAGAFDAASTLLSTAEADARTELQLARVDFLRAQIAFASNDFTSAPSLLLKAARRLEPLDASLARETYRDAFLALTFSGRLTTGVDPAEIAEAATRVAPPSDSPSGVQLLVSGWASLLTAGHAEATPILGRALEAVLHGSLTEEEAPRWLWLAAHTSHAVWNFEAWEALSARNLADVRRTGAFALLPVALTMDFAVRVFAGDFSRAAAAVAEIDAVAKATAVPILPYAAVVLAAWRGHENDSKFVETTTEEAIQSGEGQWLTAVNWANAVLQNGRGRYAEAFRAAVAACEDSDALGGVSMWALPELIEAASRCGQEQAAVDALQRLLKSTTVSGTDWGLGIEARSRALLGEGPQAEELYLTAIDRLRRAGVRVEAARAQLLYGEWLRRENRRDEARAQLRAAHKLLAEIGMESFAERARRELRTTGEKVRKLRIEARDELTFQEVQIATLAGDGHSNSEIGAALFISPRTVEWHLGKVFAKLGIGSRKELQDAMRRYTRAPSLTS